MIQNTPFTVKGFAVWGICATFFLYEFMLRTIIGTFQPPIMEDLNLNSFQFSILSSTVYFLFYGFMQLPVGIIVDQIGLKKSLLIGSFTCFVASIGLALATSYPYAMFFRMLMGLGSSFGFICLLVSVYEWMPIRYSAIFIGLSQFIGTLGPIIAAGPIASLAATSEYTWRDIFYALGIVGVVIFGLIFLIVKNNREKSGSYTVLRRPQKITVTLRKLFSRIQPWYIALFSSFSYFSIEYLSDNEGRQLLMLKGFDLKFASYMITLSWLGYAIGCPLLGLLSDYYKRRKSMMVWSAFLGILSIASILYLNSTAVTICGFFFLGIASSGQSIGFAIISEQFRKEFVAIGLALNNSAITILAVINAPLMGYVLDVLNEGGTSLANYHFVLSALLVISILGFILAAFLIKETFCKSQTEYTIVKTK